MGAAWGPGTLSRAANTTAARCSARLTIKVNARKALWRQQRGVVPRRLPCCGRAWHGGGGGGQWGTSRVFDRAPSLTQKRCMLLLMARRAAKGARREERVAPPAPGHHPGSSRHLGVLTLLSCRAQTRCKQQDAQLHSRGHRQALALALVGPSVCCPTARSNLQRDDPGEALIQMHVRRWRWMVQAALPPLPATSPVCAGHKLLGAKSPVVVQSATPPLDRHLQHQRLQAAPSAVLVEPQRAHAQVCSSADPASLATRRCPRGPRRTFVFFSVCSLTCSSSSMRRGSDTFSCICPRRAAMIIMSCGWGWG